MATAESITLGRTVEPLRVLLVPSDPFVCEITRDDGASWTDPPTLELGEAQWVATLAGAVARWDVPAADVDAVLAAGTTRVRLTVGGLVWASGSVAVTRA